MERGEPLDGTVTRSTATAAERDAAARLLGRSLRVARGLSVSLGDIDTILRRAGVHDGGLPGAVVTLTGPVTIRAEAASAEGRAWAAAFAPLEAAVAGRPALVGWLDHVRSTGLVKRLAGGSSAIGGDLLAALSLLVEELPCEDAESLATFAGRVVGRAHALDSGAPLGTLALGAARALAGLASPEPGESLSEARREAWAAVGVLCDELSSIVLTLGLTADGAANGSILTTAAAAREPIWLTLRQLVRAPPAWHDIGSVLIVENPSVVALAADQLGSTSPPLVSTHGQPRAAAMMLLRSLADAGVRLRHHGDFDWAGITIGNLLHRRLSVEPWEFDSGAYRTAARAHAHTARLAGAPVVASWDPELTETMAATGRQVEEELVAQDLLNSLHAAST
jgi:uncharacterized protein (TIGR02679 family)